MHITPKMQRDIVKKLRLGRVREEIAQEHGVPVQAVYYLVRKYGLSRDADPDAIPPAPLKTGPWSAEEVEELRKRVNMGFLSYEIGHYLGRSEQAVHMKVHRLKLSTPENVRLRKAEGNKGKVFTPRVRKKMAAAGKKTMMKRANRYRLSDMYANDPEIRERHAKQRRLVARGFEVPPEREAEYKELQAKKFKVAEIKELMNL